MLAPERADGEVPPRDFQLDEARPWWARSPGRSGGERRWRARARLPTSRLLAPLLLANPEGLLTNLLNRRVRIV
jgi:hypothetical protein